MVEKTKIKKQKNKKIDKYSFGADIIGKGGYGVVFKGLNTDTGEFVAIKQIPKSTKEQMENLMHEIDLLRKLEHENIIRYIDHKLTKNNLYIVMEYAPNGSLQDILKKYSITEKIAANYVKQVLIGLKYLHNEGVIHRDIKGANLLITSDRTIKLADFGVASSLSDAAESAAGTPYWMAPEVIQLQPATTSSDIWSVGCLVIELLTGTPPYFSLEAIQALFKIVSDAHPPIPKCSRECKAFLNRCFIKDPSMRPNAEKLLKEDWIVLNTQSDEEKASTKKVEKNSQKHPSTPKPRELSKEHKDLLSKFADDDDDEDGDWGDEEFVSIGSKLPGNQAENVSVDSGRKSIRKEQLQNLAFDRIIQQQRAKFGKAVPASRIEEDDDENLDDLLSDNDDDWDLDEVDTGKKNHEMDLGARLRKRFSDARHNIDDTNPFDDEDVFKEIDKEFEEVENEEEDNILELLETIRPEKDENVLLATCNELINVFKYKPELKSKITQHHGVLPIMHMLEVDNPAVIHATLQVINQLIAKNREFQETLCLVGALPAIMEFSKITYSTDIRIQASQFIKEMCHTSAMTLEMFIACRGLPVLVEFMKFTEEEWERQKVMIFDAIDNTMQVFQRRNDEKSNMKLPTNDFCRLFARGKIMEHLSTVLKRLNTDNMRDNNPENSKYIGKICTIMLLFAQADPVVKSHMVQEPVLSKIVEVIPNLQYEHQLSLITCLKYLTLDTNTLQSFEKTNAFQVLVSMLDKGTNIMYQAITCINSLSFLSVERQRKLTQAGVIPHLKNIIVSDDRMRNLAHKILANLAHSGRDVRNSLWEHGVADFFVSILKTKGFQHSTLEALAVWLSDDPRIEKVLLQNRNIEILCDVVSNMTVRELSTVTSSLKKLVSFGSKLNARLGETRFVNVIVNALSHRSQDALIYVEQMNILQLLFKYSNNPKSIILASYKIVKAIADDEKNQPQMVLSIAKDLVKSSSEIIKY